VTENTFEYLPSVESLRTSLAAFPSQSSERVTWSFRNGPTRASIVGRSLDFSCRFAV
jgi:hypothetical protein